MGDTAWWYVDLAAVIAIAGVGTVALFAGVGGTARVALAMPILLVCPGYAFVALLFPDGDAGVRQPFDEGKTGLLNPLSADTGIGATERFALSIVASIALVPAVALVSSASPWGVTFGPILVGVVLLTVVCSLLAIVARWRCPPASRYSPSIPAGIGPFGARDRSAFEETNVTAFNLAFALGLLILVFSAGYAIANPPQHDGFTEFAVETQPVTGETETMYRSTYALGEPQEVTVTVGNREGRDVSYTTVALLQRVDYPDGTVVSEEDELAREAVVVRDGETRRQSIEITPTMAGDDLRLVLLLYEGDAPADASTESTDHGVRLPIEVS